MKSLPVFILFIVFSLSITAQLKNKHVLIFQNGKLYENIPPIAATETRVNGFPQTLQQTRIFPMVI
jgi:hypothetical protein